jgi:chromosome segregation ATPase
MSVTLEESDVRAMLRVLKNLFGVPSRDDAASASALQTIISQITEIKMSIEDATKKATADSGKLDSLVTEVHSLKDRVTAADAAKDAALAAANAAKDTADKALQAAKDEIAALKAAAQAVPADTTEIEAALDSLGTRLDAAKAEVAAIDAAPAPSPVPVPAPVVTDPNAPQGTEQPLEQA